MIHGIIKYCRLTLGIILIIALDGCIEPYSPVLDSTESEYILVVEGLITNEPGSFVINLSRTVPIDTMAASIPESGAFVNITDDNGMVYDFIERSPGVYVCSNSQAHAESGRSYQLRIIDSNGNEYESSPAVMEPTPPIEDVYWKLVSENVFTGNDVNLEPGLNIYIGTGDLPEAAKYLRWDFTETWEVDMPNSITALDGYGMPYETYVIVPAEKKHCWVSNRADNILLKSLKNQEGTQIDSFLVQRIPAYDDRLHYKYSIEVSQYSIDAEMYAFWKSLKEFNEDLGSMYDRIPYSIFGNISSCSNSDIQVLGYFDAAQVWRKRIFINRYDHTLPTHNKYEDCLYVREDTGYLLTGGFYARSPECADCRNSGTNVKPDYWETNN